MVAISHTAASAGHWLDKPTLRTVRHWARQAKRRLYQSPIEREDIEQDLILHLLTWLGRFDAERANGGTFIQRIVRNKAATIVRDGLRKKRVAAGCVSIERLFRLEEAESEAEADTALSDAPGFPVWEERHHRAAEVEMAVAQLPERLQALCRLLGTASHGEVRGRLGLSKYRFYKLLGELRICFAEAGLGPNPENGSESFGANGVCN
jgi:DNA-directed RNA polymerase specialized sigma24 family protein